MKPLSGRESSLLALLAQSPGMTDEATHRILDKLAGTAREIGQQIVAQHQGGVVNDNIGHTAAAFIDWAQRC